MPTLVPQELGGLGANIRGRFHVDAANARIGFGTEHPEANLHVIGNVFISGAINATLTGNYNFTAGSQVSPSISFSTTANTGIFSPGVGRVGITAANILVLNANSNAIHVLALVANVGTAAIPSIRFIGDQNTGFYSPVPADTVAFASGGSDKLVMNARFYWTTTSPNAVFKVGSNIGVAGESSTNPSYTWLGNPDQGLGRTTTGNIWLDSIGGSAKKQIDLDPGGRIIIGTGLTVPSNYGVAIAPIGNIGDIYLRVVNSPNVGIGGAKYGVYLDNRSLSGEYSTMVGHLVNHTQANTGLGNVTNSYGQWILYGGTTGVYGTIRGLYIQGTTSNATNQYGLYQDTNEASKGAYTTAKNLLFSRTGIGIDPVVNVTLTVSDNVSINSNGSVTNPSYTWISDRSGFYRVGTNVFAATANGVLSASFGQGKLGINTTTPSANLEVVGNIKVSDGAETRPAVFGSQTQTGVYFEADNSISFAGGGVRGAQLNRGNLFVSGIVGAKNTARAWCMLRCFGAVVAITDGYGFSSVVRNLQGDYTLQFSNAMSSNNYAVIVGTRGPNINYNFSGGVYNSGNVITTPDDGRLTTNVRINVRVTPAPGMVMSGAVTGASANNSTADLANISVVVFGV